MKPKRTRVKELMESSYEDYKRCKEAGDDTGHCFCWYPAEILEEHCPQYKTGYVSKDSWTGNSESVNVLNKNNIGITVVECIDNGTLSIEDLTRWLAEYMAENYISLVTSFQHITRSVQFDMLCNQYDPSVAHHMLDSIIDDPKNITRVLRAPYLERILIRKQMIRDSELSVSISDYIARHQRDILSRNPQYWKASANMIKDWFEPGSSIFQKNFTCHGEQLSSLTPEQLNDCKCAVSKAVQDFCREHGYDNLQTWAYISMLPSVRKDLECSGKISLPEIPLQSKENDKNER